MSIISDIFGSPQHSPYEAAQARLAQQQAEMAQQLEAYGNAQHNAGQGAQQQAQNAVQSYAALLGTSPYTNQYITNEVGNDTAGTNRAYESAKSGLAADLAQRGLTDSSAMTGGLTGIENARAGDIANAYRNVYGQATANQYGRANQLQQLLSGNANGLNDQAMQYYGMGNNSNSQAAGQFGNVNNEWNADNTVWNQQVDGGISALASLGAMAAPGIGKIAGRAGSGIGNMFSSGGSGGGYVPTNEDFQWQSAGLPMTWTGN